jgi:hypothetical protein
MAAGALLIAAQAFGQNAGQGRAIVTLFTKHSEVSPTVSQQDVSAKVNGKEATVASWTQFKSADDGLELVILIDSGARNLGRQFEEITKFIQNVGPGAKVAIGYMQNGRAAMAGPFTSDPKQASGELHLPAGPGTNPYFSLSDLAQNWPSRDPRARREVILLTDGIDPNNRQFDPDDPYVQAAVRDSVRAELVVYTIYWRSRAEDSSVSNGGQSLMGELTDATGGNNYWSGTDNPVSFQPFFEDLQRRFANQYSLELSARLDRKPEVEILKVKIEGLGLQVTAPKQVYIVSASAR